MHTTFLCGLKLSVIEKPISSCLKSQTYCTTSYKMIKTVVLTEI